MTSESFKLLRDYANSFNLCSLAELFGRPAQQFRKVPTRFLLLHALRVKSLPLIRTSLATRPHRKIMALGLAWSPPLWPPCITITIETFRRQKTSGFMIHSGLSLTITTSQSADENPHSFRARWIRLVIHEQVFLDKFFDNLYTFLCKE